MKRNPPRRVRSLVVGYERSSCRALSNTTRNRGGVFPLRIRKLHIRSCEVPVEVQNRKPFGKRTENERKCREATLRGASILNNAQVHLTCGIIENPGRRFGYIGFRCGVRVCPEHSDV